MSKPKDGGLAFPSDDWNTEDDAPTVVTKHPGMTLRAYAALSVLPSLISVTGTMGPYLKSKEDAARIALEYADALLEELEKENDD